MKELLVGIGLLLFILSFCEGGEYTMKKSISEQQEEKYKTFWRAAIIRERGNE